VKPVSSSYLLVLEVGAGDKGGFCGEGRIK